MLRRLFLFHALVTFAAAVVLVAWPGAIPGAVGIRIDESAYLVCYLLGAAEMGTAALSLFARSLREPASLRAVTYSFAVMHFAAAGVEIYAWTRAFADNAIWANVAFRVVIGGAFVYFGVHQGRAR
ncbi:hypothetical protein BH09MYX1_BH09MYX1_05900 [soil metagenome]